MASHEHSYRLPCIQALTLYLFFRDCVLIVHVPQDAVISSLPEDLCRQSSLSLFHQFPRLTGACADSYISPHALKTKRNKTLPISSHSPIFILCFTTKPLSRVLIPTASYFFSSVSLDFTPDNPG